jgi:twitching motility protein PilJ
MSTASDATKTGKLRLGGSNLWLFLLLASMILFGVNTGVATWQGSRLADAGSKAADLQVLSQQLANQGRDAVGGNARPSPPSRPPATRSNRTSTLQGRLAGAGRPAPSPPWAKPGRRWASRPGSWWPASRRCWRWPATPTTSPARCRACRPS